jgi:hypothetical protein
MITAAATSEIQKEEKEDVSSTADSSNKKRNISRKRKLAGSSRSNHSNNVGVADTTTPRRLRCLDCGYCSCKCAPGSLKGSSRLNHSNNVGVDDTTTPHRLRCLDCGYSSCRCAPGSLNVQLIWLKMKDMVATKKIWEAATAAATQKKEEMKKIREATKAAAAAAATAKKADRVATKKIREAATAAATQKKEEMKKIQEATKAAAAAAATARKWVDQLGNPTPIYQYSTEEEVRLISMKFSPNNPDERKQYNSTKLFAKNYPMDLSLNKEQELALAWVGDENTIFKLQQHEQDQQEQPDSSQYFNIPNDGLHPAIDMKSTLCYGVKLLKLKSVNDKELMVLFCQAIDLLFTVRITHKSFWNAMLSDTDSYARDQAEGFYTWKGRFINKFFCTVFLKILKGLNLTETDIDELMKVLPPTMRSIAHLCQLAYKFMGLLDLWICERNDPHCAFGVIGNKGSILYTDYDTFQKKRSATIQGITTDANNTRELFQGAVNQVLSGGNFITTGFKRRSFSFGPMLVTLSKGGGVQMRDLIVDKDNCTAVVSEECTLKVKLKSELGRLGYSGNVDIHVRNFIRGLFGKSGMMLFGCGNAWKIKFNKENNFPSTLNLKHNGNELVPVAVTGQGKTIKKE